jgi:hypothetical protein
MSPSVVSMLATGPKVRGFKPVRGRWILRVINSVARLPSEVPCRRFTACKRTLRAWKDARRQNSGAVFHLLQYWMCMVASPLDVSGGWIRMTRTRFIVGLITHIVIYLSKPVREANARLWAVAPLMMIMMMMMIGLCRFRCKSYEKCIMEVLIQLCVLRFSLMDFTSSVWLLVTMNVRRPYKPYIAHVCCYIKENF